MGVTTIKAELRGGPLDGLTKQVNRKEPPIHITVKNPNPITYHSNLCKPLVLRQVRYCLVFKSDDLMIYAFEGHLE